MLALFSLKLSQKARDIKEMFYNSYNQQRVANTQWFGIFRSLPIGMLIASNNQVVEENKMMHNIIELEEQKVKINSHFKVWRN